MGFMGFGVRWRRRIISYLKLESTSVLVNSSPTKEFKLGKGGLIGIQNMQYRIIFLVGLNLVSIKSQSPISKICGRYHLFWVDKNEVDVMARLFGSNVGSFPFIFLGLPVGAKMNKLISWKSFFIFRAPPNVLKKLEYVRRKCFWGGSGDELKISWVNWDDVIRPWAEDRLSLGSLKCKKSLALIAKWWWRFKIETTSLWVNVIKSIYGASVLINSGSVTSLSGSNSPWSSIVKTCIKIDSFSVYLTKSFAKVIGNGNNTKF
ncbi:uncharacterized protein [Rutidosis leptorrhynchoides]|uniref:uncharacterized protein n=1 Tax=Rutidosis leptorrhynchoides TaxID=125765 RepID=UPI003A9A42E6